MSFKRKLANDKRAGDILHSNLYRRFLEIETQLSDGEQRAHEALASQVTAAGLARIASSAAYGVG